MTTTIAQQVVLDNALVPLENRDVPKIYMHQFWFTINKKDSTSYRFKIDKKRRINGPPIKQGTWTTKMQNSHAYKTYLAYATRATTPKKARKFKKPASPSKKRTLVTVEEEKPGPAKKVKNTPAKAERSKGIDLQSEAALLEESQVKKVLRRSRREQQSIKQVAQVMELVLHQGFLISLKASLDDKDVLKSDDYLEQADDEWTEFDNPRTSDDDEEET
ncbi:hypothetical protein Tco_0980463 [Tanacetum coccineum]